MLAIRSNEVAILTILTVSDLEVGIATCAYLMGIKKTDENLSK
jgi:hypothetical protein